MGDWNAHIGTRQCGVVLSEDLGDCGGPRGRRWYHMTRCSQCRAVAQRSRGAALERGCVRLGWLVLNGRCPSDPLGRITCHHGPHQSVLDLAIVPRVARADVRVVRVREDDVDHRALVATVSVGSPCVVSEEPLEGVGVLPAERPVRVKLTGAEVSVFRAFDWSPVAARVLAAGDSSVDTSVAGDRVLAAFEAAVLE